jgi:hypothetical protein
MIRTKEMIQGTKYSCFLLVEKNSEKYTIYGSSSK